MWKDTKSPSLKLYVHILFYFTRAFVCTVVLTWSEVLCAQPLQIRHDPDFRNEVERILHQEEPVDFNIVPSVLVLAWDRETIMMDTFGQPLIDVEGNRHYFEIGSLTKPIIAYLAEQALKQLHLTLDSSICAVLPDSICNREWNQISFRHILEHRAGLTNNPPHMGQIEQNADDPFQAYDIELLGRDLRQLHPKVGEYAYSNLGYASLYWLFQKFGGLSRFANTNLYLGTDEAVYVSDSLGDAYLFPGHGFDGKVTTAWHTNSLGTSLGLKSDMESLYKFVQLWISTYRNELIPLAPTLQKELSTHDRNGTYKVMHGWFILRSGKTWMAYHTGHTGGHQVSFAFLPRENQGVIIFSNGVAGSNGLSFSILTMLKRARAKNKSRIQYYCPVGEPINHERQKKS